MSDTRKCTFCWASDHTKEECNGLKHLIPLYLRRRVNYFMDTFDGKYKWAEYDYDADLRGDIIGCARAALRYAHNSKSKHATVYNHRNWDCYQDMINFFSRSGIKESETRSMYTTAKIERS